MSEPNEAFKVALADRYAVGRELGRGGMATVYVAHDLRHDRDVAVKVLKAELAAAVGSDRFLREIKITAQLNHPHILPLLDSGEANAFLFYVMPYIAGGSLRDRLRQQSPLALREVIRIAEQVSSALDHAHRMGVIHRDLKPENILFSDGHAIVADFGIAKAVSSAGGDQLTQSGFPLGTPGYMSPEQASGQSSLDPHTDVCGLGCVVYEMLVGETPGVWTTPDEVRLGRFDETLPGHRERLDRYPGRIEQVLVRALAIRPAERFPTPVEFSQALSSVAQGTERLSDGEARAVIERAAELDANLPTEGTALSIGGVEQVAAQVGIPPERVREAARDLQRPPVQRVPQRLPIETATKKKDHTIVEWSIDGELPATAHPQLVEEIQDVLGVAGHSTQLGSSLTWSPAAEGATGHKLVITATVAQGRTRIRIDEKYTLTEWRLFAPGWGAALGALAGFGVFAGLLGMGDAPTVIVPALLGGIGGGILAANGILKVMSSRRRPVLEKLAARLNDLAQRAVAGDRAGEVSPTPEQLLPS